MNQTFLYLLSELLSFIPVYLFGGVILYLGYRIAGQKGRGLHILGITIFCCVLELIFCITGIPDVTSFQFQIQGNINLTPFAEGMSGLYQYIANIIMFLPVGFFLPLLWQQFIRPLYTVGVGFMLSLGIELIQLFTYRATDIDDLLMNSLGTVAGYLLFCILYRTFTALTKEFQISWTFYRLAGFEYLFCIFTTLLLHFFAVPNLTS